MSKIIFDLTNPNLKYKGVLSAIADFEEMDKETPFGMKQPKNFIVEIFGLIWVDENKQWHSKIRLKFPSGFMQISSRSYGKDCNETKCLTEIYKFPMKEKFWFKNDDDSAQGILNIMQKNDLILSKEVLKNDV